MIKPSLLAASLTLALMSAALLASPAAAYHCPADMAKIDAALAENPQLSDEDMAKVTELRAEGEKLHNEGNHADSVKVLAEAMAVLGIQ